MSSNIPNIDTGFVQYPVPGIDNNSQGFRDRFNIIRTSLQTAKEEITDLQNTSASTNSDNNFNGNNITDVNLQSTSFEANTADANGAGLTQSKDVSWADGYLHVVKIDTVQNNEPNPNLEFEINLVGWPAQDNRNAELKLIVYGSVERPDPALDPAPPGPVLKKIIFKSNSSEDGIKFLGTNDVEVDFLNDHHVFEIFGYNNGQTVYVKYVGLFE